MRRLVFLSLLLLGFSTVFAQSHPKVDDNLQKANRRPPQTSENKPKTENQTTSAETDSINELRQIYSVGFYPTEEKPGKRRQLKVRVDKTGVAVRARESYVVGKKESKDGKKQK